MPGCGQMVMHDLSLAHWKGPSPTRYGYVYIIDTQALWLTPDPLQEKGGSPRRSGREDRKSEFFARRGEDQLEGFPDLGKLRCSFFHAVGFFDGGRARCPGYSRGEGIFVSSTGGLLPHIFVMMPNFQFCFRSELCSLWIKHTTTLNFLTYLSHSCLCRWI